MSAMPLGAVIMVWNWLNCSAAASAEKMTVVRLTGRLRGPGKVVNDRRLPRSVQVAGCPIACAVTVATTFAPG